MVRFRIIVGDWFSKKGERKLTLIYNRYDSSEMITEKILSFLEVDPKNKRKLLNERKLVLTQFIRDIIQGERND